MTRRFSKLAAPALIAFALMTSSSSESPTVPAVGTPLRGVNATDIDFGASTSSVDQEIAWARSLHAHIIRVEIPWSGLEPRRGQKDPRVLAFTDHLISQAASAGIKVIALTLSTPCWASSAPAPLLRACRAGQSSRASAWPPNNPATYGAFAAFLAARYRAKLAAIEVWNEPDQANQDYLAGPDKAGHYAAILRAAYPAIKRADSAMPVLGGSFVGSNGAFLRALYADGIKGYYDGLSVHFYNLVLASLRYTHEVQLQNGDQTPLWLNEFGWSSCWPRQRIQQEQGCVTTQTQAANVSNVFRSLARTPWVAAEILYELHGLPSEEFGVLTETGTRKPAFAALRGALVSPLAATSRVSVRLSRRGGQLVASGSGPVGDYLQLEAFSGQVLRYRSLFTLDRFNRYSLILPKALGTRDLRVSVFQYWLGAAAAAGASV